MDLRPEDSELIEFAKLIELTSTEVLEGMHHSVRGGEGIEYHSTRPYVEGEDARRLDWKRVAASDRYYVNRFEREEKTSWSIFVDGSKSMLYENKIRWASLWAGSLIFLAKTWGDRWKLLPDLDGDIEEAFRALSSSRAGVDDPEKTALHGRSTERLVVLSDFFWNSERLENAIQEWKDEFAHVYLLQILGPKEVAFHFSGVMEFRDRESSDRLILDADRILSRYRKSLKKLQEDLSAHLDEGSFSMTFAVSEGKLKNQLLSFFEAL